MRQQKRGTGGSPVVNEWRKQKRLSASNSITNGRAARAPLNRTPAGMRVKLSEDLNSDALPAGRCDASMPSAVRKSVLS